MKGPPGGPGMMYGNQGQIPQGFGGIPNDLMNRGMGPAMFPN